MTRIYRLSACARLSTSVARALCKCLVAGMLAFCATKDGRAYCFHEAGAARAIDPALLEAIAWVESTMRAAALHRNANGTRDIGLMQINSVHLPRLARSGIDEKQLLEDPCLSVRVAADLLATLFARHGYGWEAVGAYNAGSAPSRSGLRQSYIGRVRPYYASLVSARRARTARAASRLTQMRSN